MMGELIRKSKINLVVAENLIWRRRCSEGGSQAKMRAMARRLIIHVDGQTLYLTNL